MTIRIALVGIGGYGASYVSELLKAGPERDVTIAGAIDPAPERCPMLDTLREDGVPVFADLTSFYEQEQADLVVISAPIQQHAPLTCLALEHGAHVLCEKPLAGSLEDVELMLAAERASGKRVGIGFQWSFSQAILSIKRDILAGRFGKPLDGKALVLWPRGLSYYQRNRWAGRIHADDGSPVLDSPVNNATAHYLHNLLFLLGDAMDTSTHPLSVEAELYRANPIENYDAAALRVETASGAPLLFFTAHPVEEQTGPLTELFFEQAVVEDSGTGDGFKARFTDGHTELYGIPDNSPASKLWQAVEATRGGDPMVCGIDTSLPHLLCTLAAQKTPIHAVPGEFVRQMDFRGDTLTYADGLSFAFRASYEDEALPSEGKDLAWAQKAVKIAVN